EGAEQRTAAGEAAAGVERGRDDVEQREGGVGDDEHRERVLPPDLGEPAPPAGAASGVGEVVGRRGHQNSSSLRVWRNATAEMTPMTTNTMIDRALAMP